MEKGKFANILVFQYFSESQFFFLKHNLFIQNINLMLNYLCLHINFISTNTPHFIQLSYKAEKPYDLAYIQFSYLAINKQLNTKKQPIKMSQNQLQIDSQVHQKRDSILDNNLAEQVISNSVFRLMLKDIVEELFLEKTKKDMKDQGQPRISVESFVEEIGDSLIIIAQSQANKKIKEAEKFLNQMYELKVKEIGDRFQALVEKKLKEIDDKIKEIEQRTRNQSGFLSPVKSKLKNPQLMQTSVSEQINKRMQLKQKILNSSFIPQVRHSVNVQSISMLSESFNDASYEKLSQKIKAIEQNFKQQTKTQNHKLNTIRTQIKADLSECQSGIKEQMNAGFQGLWNVISNLEKRMIY